VFDLKAKLKKTRESLVSPLSALFARRSTLTAADEDAIEELLVGSDMGVDACERIMASFRAHRGAVEHRQFLAGELLALLGGECARPTGPPWPRAILVIGVNGVGKTTSVAKLAHYHRVAGHSVLLAAGDTFRAAARDQLALWAKRLDVDLVSHAEGGDPAAVAFDACTAATSREIHYAIIDTAGRLHTRANLIEELKKIRRVSEKVLGEGRIETLLTIDATLGQNSLQQAREFTRSVPTDGIILTKLDSTAKGGIVVAIKHSLGIPVRFIGAGESIEDFSEFSAKAFVDALLAT
jgi:fused signal recognition particle receptor